MVKIVLMNMIDEPRWMALQSTTKQKYRRHSSWQSEKSFENHSSDSGINGGHQEGLSPDVDHDYMKAVYLAREECYVYLYISNENPTLVDVYFDDVVMTHKRSRLIQGSEYYPYGMQTANSWTREDNPENNFLANGGTELNTTTQVYDLYYRNYDPVLGRFGQVDPVASKYGPVSPYHFGGNNPVRFNDPMGDDPTNEDLVRWATTPPLIGPHDTSDPNRIYRGSDPYGTTRGRLLYAEFLENVSLRKEREDSNETSDAAKVKSGEMTLEEYAARYGVYYGSGVNGLGNGLLALGALLVPDEYLGDPSATTMNAIDEMSPSLQQLTWRLGLTNRSPPTSLIS